MEEDYDTIDKKDNLWSVILSVGAKFDFKMMIILFILFIIITSDVFIDRILAKFNGAVNLNIPTAWGTVIQGVVLVLAYVLFDILVTYDVL